ncbi:hypothetical protein C1N32_09115 [Vibrio diazotrophicus]|uniref:Uncharacterized protein n=1 Tax=Vibrio diazotrophicus TaxID=685 RepID=A0A2J8HDE6_VIBDI|nr:hypothetical protein C1N27_14880 [Vibrio diazotrophicus]PNH91904.1 hypothetical protein C1M59_12615 [Vibrio diazotrophicus]PNH96257.1 hypothetical protein C1O24_11800 [Vibrio diazotrophicus]PNI01306.1 hypothetical protein C1O25_08750 [Vibrio diazotrophicus]PNI04952.1 hypothetical protein C1N32_09115 [Vibrio diazotrophicus]
MGGTPGLKRPAVTVGRRIIKKSEGKITSFYTKKSFFLINLVRLTLSVPELGNHGFASRLNETDNA